MSSRCVGAYSDGAYFGIRHMYNGYIGASSPYRSHNGNTYGENSFRPVITLNSNVQIDAANSGDGSTAEQAYVIK